MFDIGDNIFVYPNFYLSEHLCFLKKKTAKDATDYYIYFDLETDQETHEHFLLTLL